MVAKAIKSDGLKLGWYICEYGGRDLCPYHHQVAVDKLDWVSLYAGPPTKTIPITAIEASRRKKEAA